jgi:uncharacterized protein YjbI with pentapeptide repeats
MKIVKPMAVSFSFRPFLVLRQQRLCVSSLVGFTLGEGVRRLVSEIKLWPVVGEVIAGVIDEGLPKAGGEVLVHGSCHAPGPFPVPFTTVRLCVTRAGDTSSFVDKKLAVFGDRYWAGTAVVQSSTESVPLSLEATEPVPFREMPLGWDRAFGGENFSKNPLGRGTLRVAAEGGLARLPLPNVELPLNLVTSSLDRPDPAGFGPINVSWPQRRARAGSYGGKWLEEDFPGFARDMDPAFFSTAAEDQQIRGFFRGDEEYLLENMHPTLPVLRGRLPSVGARVLVRRKGQDGAEEVAMLLDTVVFLPAKEVGILVFRGQTPILEDDASDIAVACAACEDLDAPRSLEHYVGALEKRLDKDTSPLMALNQSDLLPLFAADCGIPEILGKLEDPNKAHRDSVRERTLARVREQLVKQGVKDPDGVLAKATEKSPLEKRIERLPDPADPADLAAYAAAIEELRAKAEQQREKALQGAQTQLDKMEQLLNERSAGAPATPEEEQTRREAFAKIAAARRAVAGEPPAEDTPATGKGPPKPRLPKMLAMFQDARAEPDAKQLEKVMQLDARALDAYRGSAHLKPPSRRLDADARERGRRAVSELRAGRASLAELDWTRYDVSGFDLSNADLHKTLLEGADLTGTNLAGANVTGAVLAHALLRRTCFDRATLDGTNLGATVVEEATFEGAKLEGAIFSRSKIASASFKGADLTGAEWIETELGQVDFEATVADGISFLPKATSPKKGVPKEPSPPMNLTKCRFARARLKKANVLSADLGGVDFTEADLELVTFVSVRADGANFCRASLRKLHAVMECSFVGACFDGADLTGAFLRGCNLRGASFEGARLDGADLSECDLTGAKLSRVQAKGVRLVGANLTRATLLNADLMEGVLQKSTLYGADLSGANLFGANLGLIRVDSETRVHGANLKRALLFPKAKDP